MQIPEASKFVGIANTIKDPISLVALAVLTTAFIALCFFTNENAKYKMTALICFVLASGFYVVRVLALTQPTLQKTVEKKQIVSTDSSSVIHEMKIAQGGKYLLNFSASLTETDGKIQPSDVGYFACNLAWGTKEEESISMFTPNRTCNGTRVGQLPDDAALSFMAGQSSGRMQLLTVKIQAYPLP